MGTKVAPAAVMYLLMLPLAVPVYGQLKVSSRPSSESTELAAAGQIVTQEWRVGMVLTAGAGAFRNVNATMTVPMDWPDQQVRLVGKDLSPGVSISSYQNVEGAARQAVVKILNVPAGKEARAILTFEVKRTIASRPEDYRQYVAPDPKKIDRKMSVFLAPSPYIDSDDPEIQAAAKEIAAGRTIAWEHARAIHDWVCTKVKHAPRPKDAPLKGMLNALHDGTGDCNELTSLFVAICRASGIPARTVCVPDHCYPEFYLLDKEGNGRWFAGQNPAFGDTPEKRPIMQKGDNVLATGPGQKRKTHFRVIPQNIMGMPAVQGEAPTVQFISEPASEE